MLPEFVLILIGYCSQLVYTFAGIIAATYVMDLNVGNIFQFYSLLSYLKKYCLQLGYKNKGRWNT